MKYSVVFVFLTLLQLIVNPAKGQIKTNSADTVNLTLNEAEKLALDQNLNLSRVQLAVDQADYQIKIVKGRFLPELNINGSYTRNIKRPVFFLPASENFPGGGGGVIEAGFDNSYSATARASLPLYNQNLIDQVDAAEIQKKLSASQVEIEQNDLLAQVRTTFFNTLLAKESYQVLQENLENAQENFENTKNLFSQGLVPEYDVIRSEVQVENLKPEIDRAFNNYRASINQLKLLLNIDLDNNLSLLNDLNDYYQSYNQLDLPDPEIRSNPQLQSIRIQAELQEQQIEISESAFYPSLSAFGNYQYQAQANNFDFSEYRWVNTSAAGIQLNIPIFAGLTRFNQVDQAELELQRIQLQRRFTRGSLSVQAQNALNQVQQARSRIDAQESNIRQAEKGYQIAQISYQKGVATQLDVNDARFALTQSRLNQIQAINDYLVALVNFQQVTGIKIFDLNELE